MAKHDIEKVILRTVAVAGVLSLALVAPNSMRMLKIFRKDRRRQRKYYVNTVISRLIKNKLVVVEGYKDKKVVRITKKGERVLDNYLNNKLPVQKIWDRKFRVIIFDIKERRRGIRDKLRRQLREWGFVKLQDSVWTYPYPCGDLVALLKADLLIGKDVVYMTVESIENDLRLRKAFNLPIS